MLFSLEGFRPASPGDEKSFCIAGAKRRRMYLENCIAAVGVLY